MMSVIEIFHQTGSGVPVNPFAKSELLTEVKVQGCVTWILHFLNLKNRERDVGQASSHAVPAMSCEISLPVPHVARQ
jgi:hypothetical protein